ncbi:ABC transporter substrate-binding protein [Microbacterium bovistercoris]|uniref:ABC transporter substrate-binding protein n=1 Tax=Microbacterium bovistercoris TaxID=2293570 RepID=A0A371NWB3_9MICO|nr:ABC transporter substrate-binding protein [Microbacterium bovistercoris]REJ07240.1 ABC transporter substrate-binding protein [Microbacterium bovistercoris]
MYRSRLFTATVGAATVALALSACTPSSAPKAEETEPESTEIGIPDADYSLDKLVEAAKKEGPLVVLDTTGKIVDMADAFSEKYGIKTTGVKMKAGEQAEVIIGEGSSGNVKNDVILMPDVPTAVSDLMPRGYVQTWFPPDKADVVPEEFQDPAIVTQETNVWAYNTEVYGDTCPVDNIWQLTEDDWHGKLSFQDPLLKTDYPNWFNQMETYGDDLVTQAYEDEYGEPLETDEASATAEWVKRLAQNAPVLTNSDDDASAAIGAPGQEDPFMGFISTAKFRDNADSGYKLGTCAGLEPWVGRAYSKVALIATGTKSPNAAKLFIHYVYTEEGIAPQVADGKLSTNSEIAIPDDEPSGLADVWDDILIFNSASAQDDFDRTQEWQDFWRLNLSK